MTNSDPSVVYVDARCFQDGNYQFRGVGHHVASLLRTRAGTPAGRFHVVALADSTMGALPAAYADLFDEITFCTNPIFSDPSIFIDTSPMTHDPRFVSRFLSQHPCLVTAAIVYDFIPLDWPGYLPSVSGRIDYLSKLIKLKRISLFAPISEYSAKRLYEVLGIHPDRVCVTGASIRRSLSDLVHHRRRRYREATGQDCTPLYFLTVGGGDRRKNTETAVRAVRQLNTSLGRPVMLKVVGHYGEDYKNDLIRFAGADASFLEFYPGVTDEDLVELYASAAATIVPSYIEGFSLPIVEAAVCGSPVLASDCAAHLELLNDFDALFPADNHERVANLLLRIVDDPTWAVQLLRSQSPLATRYHEDAVGTRFWNFVADRFQQKLFWRPQTFSTAKFRPRVAFLSPFPPEESGVARFTEMTLREATDYFDIDLYTDAARPLSSDLAFTDCGPINGSVFVRKRYDCIISVLGNSHFHTPIFDLFERYGGPCIMHDSRLTGIYHHRLGPRRFELYAARLLGRPVTADEISIWLQDQDLPSLFIEPILERAKPMIVHTRQYQELLLNRYNFAAEVATFPPNMTFRDEELAPESRAAARTRLGLADDVFVVSAFGYVAQNKGAFNCLMALEFLRSWNIPVELYFVGHSVGLEGVLLSFARELGVAQHVHLNKEFVPHSCYRDFMIASDVGIALRTYGLGQPSASLADCISAGLPTVAGNELAETCDAPFYVARLNNPISPLLLAERIAEMRKNPMSRSEIRLARRDYCETHSFIYYARRLREILGFV